jgi:hypothetical protein
MFVKLKVFKLIGPSYDGRRHGRGTYLFSWKHSVFCWAYPKIQNFRQFCKLACMARLHAAICNLLHTCSYISSTYRTTAVHRLAGLVHLAALLLSSLILHPASQLAQGSALAVHRTSRREDRSASFSRSNLASCR